MKRLSLLGLLVVAALSVAFKVVGIQVDTPAPVTFPAMAVGWTSAGAPIIKTSNDGITWTTRTSAATTNLNAIAISSQIAVAVGNDDGADGLILTTSDGITWTERTNPLSYNLFGIAYGPRFAAMGNIRDLEGGSVCRPYTVTSVSGTADWTTRQPPDNPNACASTSGHIRAVAYGGGGFAAVGDCCWDTITETNVPNTMYSADGITWARASASTLQGDLFGITYGGGTFVAVGDFTAGAAEDIATSADGTTWTAQNVPTPTDGYRAVAYGNGTYVAVGFNAAFTAGKVSTSTNATAWTDRTVPVGTDVLYAVTYTKGLFIAVGGVVGTSCEIITSPDGITWTTRTCTGSNRLAGVS